MITSDGGQDQSMEIVARKAKQYQNIRLAVRKINRGKGYSIREGIAVSSGNFIIFTDADLPYGTKYFKKIIEMIDNGADLVLANRNLAVQQADLTGSSANQKSLGMLRQLTHWGFTFFVRQLLHLKFSDTQAGLKGIKREAALKILPKLKIDRYAFDLELLLAAEKSGLKIQEVPVVLENVGQSNINIFKDSFQMLKDILKIWYWAKKGRY